MEKMTLNKMEKIKLYSDVGIIIFGVLAALFTVLVSFKVQS